MPTLSISYSANTAITMDISSLATSATFVAGYESTEIDNTINLYRDAIVNVKALVDGATIPVVGQMIQLYAWGSEVSLATTPIDVLDGVASAETLGHVSVLQSLRFVAAPAVTIATASLSYYIQPFSIAALFGGNMPKFWGLYLAHNHAGSLAALQASNFTYTGIKDVSA